MIGGLEDDTYIVDVVGEQAAGKIVELGGQGTDTIKTAITFSMALHANVENMVLTGTKGINGTGNGEDNTITGNSGTNVLSGGGGNDTLIGNEGKDTYFGDAGNDTFYLSVESILDKNIDVIKDYGNGNDTIFYELSIDPLLDVFEDFVEYKVVGLNTEIWVDFDGVGTDYTAKKVAIVEGYTLFTNN